MKVQFLKVINSHFFLLEFSVIRIKCHPDLVQENSILLYSELAAGVTR